MFPTTNNGSGIPLAVQPIQGDSLTQYFRSLSNQTGQTGAGAFNTGMKTFEQGVGAIPGAQSSAGAGFDTITKALGTLGPAADYWNAILKGGPAATAAIAPYATQVGQNYANATSSAQSMLPRGGYSSTVQAQLPFAQARDVNNSLLQLQPLAAGKVQDVATTQGNLGTAQGNIGGIQGMLAQILTSAGLGQEGQGSNMIQSVLNALLQKMGINVTESGQNKNLAANLINTAAGAIGSANVANMANVGVH